METARPTEAPRTVADIPRKEIVVRWPDDRLQGVDEHGNPEIGYSTGYPINYEELRNLKGRLLTLIDATFGDPQQRKAQKDCVWQALQAWMYDIQWSCGEEPIGVAVYDGD